MSSLFGELLNQKPKLNPATTRVTNRGGDVFIEEKDGSLTLVGKTTNLDYFKLSDNTLYSPCVYTENVWTTLTPEPETKTKESVQVSELSFISYNVWFSDKDKEIRAKALLELLIRKESDVICLQEVTSSFLAILLAHPFIQESYSCSDSSGYKSITPYGVIIFVKRQFNCEFILHQLPTQMARKALSLELNLNGNKFILVTAHLESMNNAEVRRMQLVDTIYPILADAHYGVFMGDSNFCTFSYEYIRNVVEPGALRDAWKEKNPTATLEESRTMLTKHILALDRVLYSSETMSIKAIERIGGSPIFYDGEMKGLPAVEGTHLINNIPGAILPSDHLGIYSILSLNKNQ